MTIEAMKQALEALESERDKYVEWGDEDGAPEDVYEAINALRTAIAEAEKQEPVAQAWAEGYRAGIDDERTSEANIGIAGMGMKVEPARNNPYRATPPAAQRQPLTDEQIEKMMDEHSAIGWTYWQGVRDAEAAHGIAGEKK